ncbi:MAG: hypothetical protein K0S36_1313 [Nitrosospira multiformis]|jgi:hypothetical protein|nr:hypothetical protein [Nitrosospira multiformis]
MREIPLITVPACHRHGLGFCPSHRQVLSDRAIEVADGDTGIQFLAIYEVVHCNC